MLVSISPPGGCLLRQTVKVRLIQGLVAGEKVRVGCPSSMIAFRQGSTVLAEETKAPWPLKA